MSDLAVLIPQEGESWSAYVRRAEACVGELLLIVTAFVEVFEVHPEQRDPFLDVCASLGARARFAVRQRALVRALRARGLRVVDRVTDLRVLLADHAMLQEALRSYSPHVWRQHIRSRLQTMGLLTVPKLRIWLLCITSIGLFLFVLLWLLPSARITIWPREDSVSQTANVWLVQSGSTVDVPPRVRTMELMPIRIEVHRSLTFDQITKDFAGERAHGEMTVINRSTETYSLRSQTRITNNAGMLFYLLDPISIDPGEEITVRVESADMDLYGEVIGERGNLAAGLRWDFPGLTQEERQLVYAENRAPLQGGMTSFRTLLHEQDLAVAQKQLEQELLATAKQLVEEEKLLHNSKNEHSSLEILYYDELTTSQYHDFVLPNEFLGQQVTSIPIDGALTYTAYAYDAQKILELLRRELVTHVGEGKQLLADTIGLDRLVAHVIDYADDLSWIKLTVDLSGTEQYVLDPLSPTGARFSKHVRELVAGLSRADALRILRNLPEVDNAQIHIWPPWNSALPHIPSHISIETLKRSSTVR
jgi:hypothetical protein